MGDKTVKAPNLDVHLAQKTFPNKAAIKIK